MDCCGNPLHDIPTIAQLLLPVLATFGMWLRTLKTKRAKRKTGRTT